MVKDQVRFKHIHLGSLQDVQTTILQNLRYSTHLSESMADLLNLIATDYDCSQALEDVLRYENACVSLIMMM
jgi:hypothetical protein